jgi:hypothetical protein
MLARLATALTAVFLLAACSSAPSPPQTDGPCSTVSGVFKVTVTPAAPTDCTLLLPDVKSTWYLSTNPADAQYTGDLSPVPGDATVDARNEDVSACSSNFVWHRAPAANCAAPSESAAIDLTFTAKGFTGTVDFAGCAFEGIALYKPAGCAARYTVTGVAQ